MSDFLQQYRTQLKLDATNNLEQSIEKVFHIISDRSKLKNDIILLQARYQSLEQESIKGIISEPDRLLRGNRIVDSLFQLIDNIQVADLQESDYEELNNFLIQQPKQKTNISPTTSIDKSLESKPESSSEVLADAPEEIETRSIVQEEDTTTETPIKTSKDLEVFSELNGNPLSFYPTIYRDIRSRIFRNPKPSTEIGKLINLLTQQLPALLQFKDQVNNLEPIIKKIRVDHNNRPYWLQYQQIRNQRTALTMETLTEINKMNESIEALAKLLREKGLY